MDHFDDEFEKNMKELDFDNVNYTLLSVDSQHRESKGDNLLHLPVPDSEHLSDTTNAELVAQMFGDDIRYDHKRKRWLVWGGQMWEADQEEKVGKYVIEAMRDLFRRSGEISDSGKRLKVAKWATQSEGKIKIDACLGILKILKPISDKGEDWDSDPTLLSCPNGIVDLTTGKLREGQREDRITQCTETNYNPEAKCARWEKFVKEIFADDKNLIRYIHKALGYSITGDTSEQVCFFSYGSGANGKSVTFKAVRKILGDYGHDSPSTLLKRSYNNSNSNDLASIDGKRFLVSSETLSTSKINEERLKALTGGDQISARFLHKEFFSFTPVCHIWLFMNHRPQTEDDSFGFWRRIRCIPFKVRFVGDKADKDLSKKLEAENEGILKWLVDGCLLWYKEGLEPTPEAINVETADYQSENDDLYDFLQSLDIESGDIKANEIYQKYISWTDGQRFKKEDVMTKTAFGRRMSDRFQKTRKFDGNYYKYVKNSTYFVPTCIVDTPISINTSIQSSIRDNIKTAPNYTSIHTSDIKKTPLEKENVAIGRHSPIEDTFKKEIEETEVEEI